MAFSGRWILWHRSSICWSKPQYAGKCPGQCSWTSIKGEIKEIVLSACWNFEKSWKSFVKLEKPMVWKLTDSCITCMPQRRRDVRWRCFQRWWDFQPFNETKHVWNRFRPWKGLQKNIDVRVDEMLVMTSCSVRCCVFYQNLSSNTSSYPWTKAQHSIKWRKISLPMGVFPIPGQKIVCLLTLEPQASVLSPLTALIQVALLQWRSGQFGERKGQAERKEFKW